MYATSKQPWTWIVKFDSQIVYQFKNVALQLILWLKFEVERESEMGLGQVRCNSQYKMKNKILHTKKILITSHVIFSILDQQIKINAMAVGILCRT